MHRRKGKGWYLLVVRAKALCSADPPSALVPYFFVFFAAAAFAGAFFTGAFFSDVFFAGAFLLTTYELVSRRSGKGSEERERPQATRSSSPS